MRTVKTAKDLDGLQFGESFRFDGDTFGFLRIMRTIGDTCIVNTSHASTDNVLQINVPVKDPNAKALGSIVTPASQAASRENGKKGGRPITSGYIDRLMRHTIEQLFKYCCEKGLTKDLYPMNNSKRKWVELIDQAGRAQHFLDTHKR